LLGDGFCLLLVSTKANEEKVEKENDSTDDGIKSEEALHVFEAQ
jgi:hypothetical protein